MSLQILNYAKSKLLEGDYNMATSYYNRAKSEGAANCIVNLRYLTKEYLVFPLEYENSSYYFELLNELHKITEKNPDYTSEYVLALNSLIDIRRLFMRSLSLFYFSDILVTPVDSVVVREIAELQRYIKTNKNVILDKDCYEIEKYIPGFNKKKLTKDLNIIEAYCMNILLSYTAEQHSIYQGKRYSATTVDYGYFYSTTVRESDKYYNYANIKPRMFILGYEAYYYDLLTIYKDKLKEIRNFDSPKELKKELTSYVKHTYKKDASAKEFRQYAKHFEKQDFSRDSWFGSIFKLTKAINPFLKIDPTFKMIESNVGSFELNEYFPQKKFLGVCSMLAAGQGWKVDTVRYIIALLSAFGGIGVMVYLALAVAKKFGFHFGVNIERP